MEMHWRKILLVAAIAFAPAAPARAQVASFSDGLAARGSWESWFNAQQGGMHDGAYYWSGQRSLAHPGSCVVGPSSDPAWVAGCEEAQRRLAVPDARRRVDQAYRAGWNSYGTAPAQAPTEAAEGTGLPVVPPALLPSDPMVVAAQASCPTWGYGAPIIYQQESVDCLRRRDVAQASMNAYQARREAIQADRNRQVQAIREQQERARIQQQQDEAQAERDRIKAEQVRAETAEDNYCRTPSIAKMLMTEFGGLERMKALDMRAVDIEHLTTVAFDNSDQMACHGTFVMTNGRRLTGTLTFRKNVADEMIVVWTPN